ncbi:NDP-hexose 2,3-dehydratase family protein [Streptomyces sp. NPDC053427]|uniref:NDP-hexose 2,3-dehydratase family protein n=1 Tax=Streptomyces sp. NPDC053427 TaxID=3365701 RepID=UPI0037D1DD46
MWRADADAARSDGPATAAASYAGTDFHEWWEERHRVVRSSVETVPFEELEGWKFEEGTENLVHESGAFFTVQGMRIRTEDRGSWSQPVINQPEIGILGMLVKEFDGVPHYLVQAKVEPGNLNGLQLSPTVQATRSNFTRVHGGAGTRYLEYFRGGRRGEALVDVLQSEQGSWFWHKRNRNMVVRVTDEVPLHEDFRWVSSHQLHGLLTEPHLVNMDTRTVLACSAYTGPPRGDHGDDPYADALARSYDATAGARLHTRGEILSWFTDMRTRCGWRTELIPLSDVKGWSRSREAIEDDERRRFRIIGVRVKADNREVRQWTQPLLAPTTTALAAFLTKPVDGVLHLLVRARPEPGVLDTVEMGPTVQCVPETDGGAHEPFYEDVARAGAQRVRFDTTLSEEGGRFYHARTRYLIVEADEDFPVEVPDDHRWMAVHQLTDLLRHKHYVNIEARSLLACLHSLR